MGSVISGSSLGMVKVVRRGWTVAILKNFVFFVHEVETKLVTAFSSEKPLPSLLTFECKAGA
jgi:hypothetical protein